MKPNWVTGRVANSVVKSLYQSKNISWARVFEEVIDQQIRLLGPNNLNSSLPGYLAPIYAAKEVLTWKERATYWLTQKGGDLDEKKKTKVDLEAETKPEGEEEPVEEDAQDEDEAVSRGKSPLAEECTPRPLQPKQELARLTRSREKATKAIPNPDPAPSTSKRAGTRRRGTCSVDSG
jgi:hypothetical protein